MDRLHLYESSDLVREFYQQRHSLKMSASKARQVITYVRQGRELFQLARAADDLIAPMILYYGVLPYSRGLLIFLDPPTSDAQLAQGHGLTASGWTNTLAQGPSGLLDLKIRVESDGTFEHLARLTRNANRVTVYEGSTFGIEPVHWVVEGTLAFPSQITIQVSDVLSRMADLHGLSQELLSDKSLLIPTTIVHHFRGSEHDQIGVACWDVKGELPSREHVIKLFDITDDENFGTQTYHPLYHNREHWHLSRRKQDSTSVRERLPYLTTSTDGQMFAVMDMIDGGRFSRLSQYYVIAYAGSMLTRYYPSIWQSLLTGSTGDRAFPLFQFALRLVEESVPKLILEELIGV